MASFNQWQSREYPAGDAPFRAAEVAGPQPFFRNDLDALRSMWRRTPEAQYADGYLGTINPRREGRMQNSLANRTNNRPYTRGVHKGERLDGRDYFWPDEFNLMSGLIAEDQGVRFVIPGALQDAGMVGPDRRRPEGSPGEMARVGPRGAPARVGTVEWGKIDPDRNTALRRLSPPSKSGPGMGMAVPYPGR